MPENLDGGLMNRDWLSMRWDESSGRGDGFGVYRGERFAVWE